MFGANFQSQIVGHSKNPAPGILYVFALLERDIQPEEHFLCGFLRLGRVQSEAKQIAINVVARFDEQLGYLVLERHGRAVAPHHAGKLFAK